MYSLINNVRKQKVLNKFTQKYRIVDLLSQMKSKNYICIFPCKFIENLLFLHIVNKSVDSRDTGMSCKVMLLGTT